MVTTSRERVANVIALAQGITRRGLGRFLFTDRATLRRCNDNVLVLPWLNGRGETVTVAAQVFGPWNEG